VNKANDENRMSRIIGNACHDDLRDRDEFRIKRKVSSLRGWALDRINVVKSSGKKNQVYTFYKGI
jgi:hypothetical protein